MSTARVLPWPERGRSPLRAKDQTRPFPWFGWWIAFCMVVIAYNSQLQLRLQQEMLTGSRELERAVAESRQVSVQTNLQLQRIEELDRSTTRLDDGLERLGQINAALKAELMGLSRVADAMQGSLSGIDTQTAENQRLLNEIMRESSLLQRLLVESRQVGEQVSTRLYTLVHVQERINGDLVGINQKTRILDWRR